MRKNKKDTGRFITVEGGEGAGKSTLIASLSLMLQGGGWDVLVTREPGGTPFAEALRSLLLSHEEISPHTELLAFAAARSDHVHKVIQPALEQGRVVLCDRFTDSTMAYQSGGRGLPPSDTTSICAFAASGLAPHITFFLDIPPEEGLQRKRGDIPLDRLEAEDLSFHRRVYGFFQRLSIEYPQRVIALDAHLPPDKVCALAWQHLAPILPRL